MRIILARRKPLFGSPGRRSNALMRRSAMNGWRSDKVASGLQNIKKTATRKKTTPGGGLFALHAETSGREAALDALAIAEEGKAGESRKHHRPCARVWDRGGRALGLKLQSFDLAAHVDGTESVRHDGERVRESAKRERWTNRDGR